MLKTKKQFIARIFLTIAACIATLTIPLRYVSADEDGALKTFLKYVFILIAWILKMVLMLLTYCMKWVGEIFDIVYKGGLNIFDLPVVTQGWGITRDVLNMFFVIALLIIAFATILRIESYQYKILLPKLIYAALLVNFSRTIARVIIDFSNTLMTTLLNLSGGTISQHFAYTLFSTSPTNISNMAQIKTGNSFDWMLNLCIAEVVVIGILGLLVVAIFLLSAVMIARNVVLMILVILSPAAFVLNILPVTQTYSKKWWDEFLKYVFYGPVAAFCVYLSIMVSKSVKQLASGAKGWILSNPKSVSGGIFSSANMYSILVMIGFMFMSVMVIRALSPMAAGMATGLAKRGFGLAGKAASFGGGWAGRRIGRSLAKGNEGLIGKAVGTAAGGVAGLGGLLTGSTNRMRRAAQAGYGLGNAVRVLNPKMLSKAYNDIQERKDRKAYGTGTGWVRNKMNKMLDRKDQTDYEALAYRQDVADEFKSLQSRNPSLRHELITSDIKRATKGGDKAQLEALYRALWMGGNPNELTQMLAADPKAKELMHTDKFLQGKQGIFYDPETGRKLNPDNPKDMYDYEIARSQFEAYKKGGASYAYYPMQDMFKKAFGEKHGLQLMADLGDMAKRNGDFVLSEGVKVDTDGKVKFNSLSGQAEGMAIDLSKLDADGQNAISRFTVRQESYDKEGKPAQQMSLQSGYKKFLSEKGLSEDAVDRLNRKMPAKTQEAIVSSYKELNTMAEVVAKTNKEMARAIQEQFNNAATNLKSNLRIDIPELKTPKPPESNYNFPEGQVSLGGDIRGKGGDKE